MMLMFPSLVEQSRSKEVTLATEQEYLMDLWRDLCDLPPLVTDEPAKLLCQIEGDWSPRFEALFQASWFRMIQLMKNRRIIAGLRYNVSTYEKQISFALGFDLVKFMERRLQQYKKIGNIEKLVDVANGALLEFEFREHPNKHFRSEEVKNRVDHLRM
jgi:hypothetical protein